MGRDHCFFTHEPLETRGNKTCDQLLICASSIRRLRSQTAAITPVRGGPSPSRSSGASSPSNSSDALPLAPEQSRRYLPLGHRIPNASSVVDVVRSNLELNMPKYSTHFSAPESQDVLYDLSFWGEVPSPRSTPSLSARPPARATSKK